MMDRGESQQNIRGIAFNYRQPLFVFPVDTGTKADQMEQQQKREKRARSGSHVPWLDMHRCSLGHPPSQQAVQWIRYLLGGFALGSLVPWMAILLQIRPFRKSESESWLDRVRFNFPGKPHGWRRPAPRRDLEPRNLKHTRLDQEHQKRNECSGLRGKDSLAIIDYDPVEVPHPKRSAGQLTRERHLHELCSNRRYGDMEDDEQRRSAATHLSYSPSLLISTENV